MGGREELGIETEALMHGSAAIVAAGFALVTLFGRPTRALNQFLAFFLFLIAGNQGAEVMRTLAATEASKIFWFRIASVFSFLDPLALYYLGSLFPERNSLNDTWKVSLVAAGSIGLTFTVPLLEPLYLTGATGQLILRTWMVFTAIVYTVVFVHVAKPLWNGDPSRGHRFAYLALCLVAIPAWTRAWGRFDILSGNVAGFEFPTAWRAVARAFPLILLVVGVLALAWYGRRNAAPEHRTWLVGGLIFMGLVALPGPITRLYNGLRIAGVVTGGRPDWLFPPGLGDAVRWFGFGFLLSASLFRERILDLSFRARQHLSRGIVIVGIGALLIALIEILQATPIPIGENLGVGQAVLAIIVLAFTQGFRRVVDRVAESVYGVSVSGELASKIENYRTGVRQAIQEGRSLGSDPELERLRETLDLDPETARAIERMAGGSPSGPVTEGKLVEGRYRIVELLGRGSFGRSFLAEDTLLNRKVVVKEVLHADAGGTREIVEESRAASAVKHPNVVDVHDVLHRSASSLIVFEHVADGSLADLLDDQPLDPLGGALLVESILRGLEAIHEAGVVHRDLEPNNILLDGSTPKIADFGLASPLESGTVGLDGDAGPAGTPGFRAPELAEGQPPSPRSDLFAVGRILEEAVGEELPEGLAAIVARATDDDPARRYSDAQAMRNAVASWRRSSAEREQRAAHADEVPWA